MGGLLKKPKVDRSAQDRAEKAAKEAEAKAARDAAQSEADAEYRRKRQTGKSGTILSTVDDAAPGTRTMLGG